MLIPFLALGSNIQTRSFEDVQLYPASEPYYEGFLQVSDLHQIYYAEFGNPLGLPVVVVHGGPGAGCSSNWSSFFDLSYYRVIMFDQRGAPRSTPVAEMRDNTPQKSVEDMEILRNHLGIEKWLLFGGSWGSALSILYGEAHPERALGFVLRGIFLARQRDYEHLFYGMDKTFPEAWEEMVQFLPIEERDYLISAFHKRIMDPDPQIHLPAAHAFMRFDMICSTLLPNSGLLQKTALDDRFSLACARAFIHYSANQFFLKENQLLEEIGKISHLPAIILNGRYDIICPPKGAYELHTRWQNSQLWFLPNGGHVSTEPCIARGLKHAMDEMKIIIQQ